MNLCNHPEAVKWNPDNGVVQCHACGHVWVPLDATAGDEYRRRVTDEQSRLAKPEPIAAVVENEWFDRC